MQVRHTLHDQGEHAGHAFETSPRLLLSSWLQAVYDTAMHHRLQWEALGFGIMFTVMWHAERPLTVLWALTCGAVQGVHRLLQAHRRYWP